jgi:O-antigen/teichoic acid export membrane protein
LASKNRNLLAALTLTYRPGAAFKSILIYTGANFLNKGVSFLLLFYFTHVLSSADFGMLNLFSNGVLFFMPFVSLGILQSASAEYFKLDKQGFADFFSSSMLLPMLVTIFSVMVMCMGREALLVRQGYSMMFLLLPVVGLFSFLNEQLISMVRNAGKPTLYLGISLGRLLTEAALAIWMVSALQYGWQGRATALLISYFAVGIYAIYYFKQQGFWQGRLQKRIIASELKFSVPIIVMQLSVFCMSSCGGYFIAAQTGSLSQTGVFSIAATYSSLVLVFCTALLQYMVPQLYRMLAHASPNYAAIKKQFLLYTALMTAATLLIAGFAPLAYGLALQPAYLPGLSYCGWLCAAQGCWGISYYLYSFMLFNKQKRKIMVTSVVAISVSTILNYWMVGQWGAQGAAMAILAVHILVLLLAVYLVKDELKRIWVNG